MWMLKCPYGKCRFGKTHECKGVVASFGSFENWCAYDHYGWEMPEVVDD